MSNEVNGIMEKSQVSNENIPSRREGCVEGVFIKRG